MSRNALIDILKAFLIALVVAGHAIQWTTPSFLENWMFVRIYAFHMAAFFFISGFFSFSQQLQFRKDIRRIALILGPYIVWDLLAFTGLTSGALWFLLTLAVFESVELISRLIAKILRIPGPYIMAALFLAVPFIDYMLGRTPQCVRIHYFITFTLGALCRYHWPKLKEFLCDEKGGIWMLCIGVVCVVFYPQIMSLRIVNHGMGRLVAQFTISSAMAVGLFSLFNLYRLERKTILSRIGEMTLGIYASHYVLLNGVKYFWPNISCWPLFGLAFIGSIVFVFVVSRIPIIDILLVGKINATRKVWDKLWVKV